VPQGRSGRAENLVPTGIRSRTVQPAAQSLYRLSYPAYVCIYTYIYIYITISGELVSFFSQTSQSALHKACLTFQITRHAIYV